MNPLCPSVKCMIGRTGNHIKSRVHNGLPHLNGCSESWIITVFRILRDKGRLLINDTNVTFIDDSLHLFKQKVEISALIQTVSVDRFMDQVIAEYHKRNFRLILCEPPGVPSPTACFPFGICQQKPLHGILSAAG